MKPSTMLMIVRVIAWLRRIFSRSSRQNKSVEIDMRDKWPVREKINSYSPTKKHPLHKYHFGTFKPRPGATGY